MTFQAQLVMILWMPLVIYLFARFPSTRAATIGVVVAWLFLPQRAGFSVIGLPDYERMSATCYGILLGTLLFDRQRLTTFRLGWIDIPAIVWCLCPAFSSLSNNLGPYDALSQVFNQTVTYGLPYFLGRIYYNSLAGLRQLALAIVVGGAIYIPLCLYEIRMSPQLHRMVYGYHGINQFVQGIRYGGYRPSVFMSHGLSVGMWMMAATLIAIWLWQAGAIATVLDIPVVWLSAALLVTLVLVKSTGAYVYFFYGIIILFIGKKLRKALPVYLLIAILSIYIFLGASGNFSGAQGDRIVEITSQIIDKDRADSLAHRLDNEQILAQKAREQWLFGWGGWGRNRVYEEDHYGDMVDITVTDSLWIIAFGNQGAVGLISVFGLSLLPALVFCTLCYPVNTWFNPKVAPAAALTVTIVLYMLDSTLNNHPNPIFTLASGGIAGITLKKPEILKKSTKRSAKTGYSLTQSQQRQR